jgi:hypothetical protein
MEEEKEFEKKKEYLKKIYKNYLEEYLNRLYKYYNLENKEYNFKNEKEIEKFLFNSLLTPINEILPNLYLGNLKAAKDYGNYFYNFKKKKNY